MASFAKTRYQKLASKHRNQFLQRARHNALLTLPSLMPLEGQSGTSHLVEPYQGMGARGVTHLSSRLTLGLLPAGRPYMRFDLPPEIRMQTQGETPSEIERNLALAEQLVQSEVERARWRTTILQALQQLLVAGNVLPVLQEDNSIRLFRLDQFVVRRDHGGRLLELIIEELFDRDALPEAVKGRLPARSGGNTDNVEDEEIRLYTHVRLVQEKGVSFYKVHQELEDARVEGTDQQFELDELPYFALRWTATPGEDYGRSKIEEHIADLRSLEALEKGLLELAAMASRWFIMMRPGATAGGLKDRLKRAINGDVVVGDPDAVELKAFENNAGFQVTAQQVQSLRESLAGSFLLLSGGQRDAERVTAAEIERDVQELEAALGGNFSALSVEMMGAMTELLVLNMQRAGKLPAWPKGTVTPTILTGIEALSRERDVGRALQAGQLVQTFGPEASDVVKLDKILGKAFVGLGFPDSVNTPEETQEIREIRAQREALQKGAAGAIPQVAKAAIEQQGGEQ